VLGDKKRERRIGDGGNLVAGPSQGVASVEETAAAGLVDEGRRAEVLASVLVSRRRRRRRRVAGVGGVGGVAVQQQQQQQQQQHRESGEELVERHGGGVCTRRHRVRNWRDDSESKQVTSTEGLGVVVVGVVVVVVGVVGSGGGGGGGGGGGVDDGSVAFYDAVSLFCLFGVFFFFTSGFWGSLWFSFAWPTGRRASVDSARLPPKPRPVSSFLLFFF